MVQGRIEGIGNNNHRGLKASLFSESWKRALTAGLQPKGFGSAMETVAGATLPSGSKVFMALLGI